MPDRAPGSPGLSLHAYARHRGVTEKAVRKALTAGRLPSARRVNGRWVLDPAQADREWAANTGRVPSAPGAEGDGTLAEAQRRVAVQRERKLRLENRVRRGALIDARTASRQRFEQARALRDALLALPARLAAELAATADPLAVRTRLADELHAVLTGLAGEEPA